MIRHFLTLAAATLLLASAAATSAQAATTAPSHRGAPAPTGGEADILRHQGFFIQKCVGHGPDVKPNAGPTNMTYHCGPVMTTPGIALIFWGTGADPAGEVPYLTNFVKGIGGSGWLNTVTQYYQNPPKVFISNPANQLVGYFVDYNPIPFAPTNAQVGAQALLVARKYGYSANVNYFVALAPGHEPSWARPPVRACGLHSWAAYKPGKLLSFTVFPYMPDLGARCGAFLVNGQNGINDGTSILAGHEIAEAYTDPFGSAWYYLNGAGEIGDLCQINPQTGQIWAQNVAFATGVFPVQPIWDNAISGCAFNGP